MAARDVVITEVGAALTIASLLLAFLPLFLQSVANAKNGKESADVLSARKHRAWSIPVLIFVAVVTATVGLLHLWGWINADNYTAGLSVGLFWLLVGLAVWAVASEV